MTDIPEPQRREVPKYYESGAIMQTVRFDLKKDLATATNSEVRATLNRGVVDEIMDGVECMAWKKFDVLRAAGAFKKKVAFFTLDGAPIVEGFLKKIFGDRPAGCL